MAKRLREKRAVLIEGPLDPGKPGKAKYRTAERDGTQVKLRIVDADSPNFAADFRASFAANVRLARRENGALPVNSEKLKKIVDALNERQLEDRDKNSDSQGH